MIHPTTSRYRIVVALTQCLLWATMNNAHATDDARALSLEDVDTITIMPIVFPGDQAVEDRAERLEGLYGNLDDYIYKALLRKLALKGYVLDRPRGWSRPADWSVENLKPLAPQTLAALAPDTASYVAFLFIERIESSGRVVQASANAAVSAIILHRKSATVVWRKSGEGEFSEHILQIFSPLSGPLGMLLTPDKHAAVESAFGRLFADFPEKSYR